MSEPEPPRLATWLLQRFAAGTGRESMVGDLVERYRSGRSSAWYWRQTLAAILLGVASDLRSHTSLATRALVVGWTLYLLFSFPMNWLTAISRAWIVDWFARGGHYSFWSVFWSGHLPGTFLVYLACFVSGSIVGRLHQGYAAAMVCLYAASVLVFEYGTVSWMFARHGQPPGFPQAALFIPAVLLIGRPLSILVGGLWITPPESDSLRRRSVRSS
jgi:hypothetical protein